MIAIQRFIRSLDVRVNLIILSLLAVAWLQMPRLTDGFRVDEDFRYFYWTNKYFDPTLFPNDTSQIYLSAHLPWGDVPVSFYNLGYSLLFYAASFLVTPIFFSKILPFVLMPVTVWYLFEFGQSVRDRRTGVVLALGFLFLNLASSSAISIANGMQRSFATPLIIAFIYYLHRQKYLFAAITVFASALIYAPVFVLIVPTWGLYILKPKWRPNFAISLGHGGVGYLLIALCASILVLSPILPKFTNFFTVENTIETASDSFEHLWENPRFRTGGGVPLFIIFPIVGRGGLVDLGEDLINLLILATLGGLIYLVRGRRAFELPQEIWYLLWATLIMFIMSWLAIWLTDSFLLYLPSRYTRVGLYLFLVMFVFLNAVGSVKKAPDLIRHNPRRLIWLIAGMEFLVVGLVLMYPTERATINGFNMKWLLALTGGALGVLGVAIIRKPPRSRPNLSRISQTLAGRTLIGATVMLFLGGWAVYAPLFTEVSYLNPPPAERELLQFLRTVPKDALIAGSPCALDSVQLFAARQVFFTCEAPPAEDARTRQALMTYYTDNWQDVLDFCQSYSIDYLVVDLATYSDEYLAQGWIFFEPFNQELLPYVASRDTFVLTQVPDDIKLFQSENYYVVACDALGKLR